MQVPSSAELELAKRYRPAEVAAGRDILSLLDLEPAALSSVS